MLGKTMCVLAWDHNEYSCDEPREHGEITRICTGLFEVNWDCWDWDRSVFSPPTSFLRKSRNCRNFSCVSLQYCGAEEGYYQTYWGSVEELLADSYFPLCLCCILRRGQEQHMSWSLYSSNCNGFTGSKYTGGQDRRLCCSVQSHLTLV